MVALPVAKVFFDTRELVKFVKLVEKMPAKMAVGAAQSLNVVGELAVNEVVYAVSQQIGLEPDIVRNFISVQPASPSNLSFKIDASSAFSEEMKSLFEDVDQRPMIGRRRFARRPTGYFHAGEMVNVVTWGDDKVCPICIDLEEGGPYTIEEIRGLMPIQSNGMPGAHPNCRCLVSSSRSKRELPVRFSRAGSRARVSSVTTRQLMDRLRNELKITMRAI